MKNKEKIKEIKHHRNMSFGVALLMLIVPFIFTDADNLMFLWILCPFMVLSGVLAHSALKQYK